MVNAELGPHSASGTRRRHAWLAFALGLLVPGLGHLYAGVPWRAFAALAVSCGLILPAARLIVAVLSWSPMAVAVAAAVAVAFGLLVPFDGFLVARRRRKEPPGIWNRLWIYLLYAITALPLLLAVNLWMADHFWVRFFQVRSYSMKPTLLPGDYVLADARRASLSSLRAGDVVVYGDPGQSSTFYVKRIAALAGQKMTMPNDPTAPRLVPEGHLFVLGDNLSSSVDGRHLGPLPVERVRGRVDRILFSRDPVSGRVRWQRMGRPVGCR